MGRIVRRPVRKTVQPRRLVPCSGVGMAHSLPVTLGADACLQQPTVGRTLQVEKRVAVGVLRARETADRLRARVVQDAVDEQIWVDRDVYDIPDDEIAGTVAELLDVVEAALQGGGRFAHARHPDHGAGRGRQASPVELARSGREVGRREVHRRGERVRDVVVDELAGRADVGQSIFRPRRREGNDRWVGGDDHAVGMGRDVGDTSRATRTDPGDGTWGHDAVQEMVDRAAWGRGGIDHGTRCRGVGHIGHRFALLPFILYESVPNIAADVATSDRLSCR